MPELTCTQRARIRAAWENCFGVHRATVSPTGNPKGQRRAGEPMVALFNPTPEVREAYREAGIEWPYAPGSRDVVYPHA